MSPGLLLTSDINPVKSSREMRNMRAGYRSLYYRTQTALRQCRPCSIALKSWNQHFAYDCPVYTPPGRVNPTIQTDITNA
ncbi:hypothetical protein Q5691_22225 [Microcoleus sp. w1-18aA5]|uniref:hypothetical protein n=1 Tax=unclassified Microcoleus TaxID=2642155 RepID=UPI002FCFAF40